MILQIRFQFLSNISKTVSPKQNLFLFFTTKITEKSFF